jgi:hypothetical protein
MTLAGMRKRVGRLEVASRAATRAGSTEPSEEEWYEKFAAAGEAGEFDHEPTFRATLEGLRRAIAEASEGDPPTPFLPPAHYRPDLPEPRRRVAWRRGNYHLFPEVTKHLLILLEMINRTVLADPAGDQTRP